MFCKNCGNEMSEGALFCSNCGASPTGSVNAQPVVSAQTVVAETPKKKMSKKKKWIIAGVSVFAIGLLIFLVLVVVIFSVALKGCSNSDGEMNNLDGMVHIGGTNNIPQEGVELLEAMKGDWEASLTGGFYGSHYYIPHWDLFIDSDFIYVTDGAVFNHDINDVDYIKENGVEYIVFEDVIWHRETRSSVEVVEAGEIMPIRLSFIENGQKIAFEINPDGTEWKLIAEYRRAGTKEEAVSENTEEVDGTYYRDLGVEHMDTVVTLVLMQYSTLQEFDAVIQNQYGGDASAALNDLMITLSGALDAETEAWFEIIGKYYVDAIAYYEANGCYDDATMIKLGQEVAQ